MCFNQMLQLKKITYHGSQNQTDLTFPPLHSGCAVIPATYLTVLMRQTKPPPWIVTFNLSEIEKLLITLTKTVPTVVLLQFITPLALHHSLVAQAKQHKVYSGHINIVDGDHTFRSLLMFFLHVAETNPNVITNTTVPVNKTCV